MARLVPYPFGLLVTRMIRELEQSQSAFDLPVTKFFRPLADKDLSVTFQGQRASSPLGPAAGPHTQMAQNLALSWLAGSRILELKTVQILDQLVIPRPCIDMRTVGFNAEWSQELTLEESLEEYVKGAMLIEILRFGGFLPAVADGSETLFDMSVGYDYAGISSQRVRAFIHGMRNARPLVDRLRSEIPPHWKQLRDLDFPTRLSDNITLSTFHGCPPGEIERIVDFLLRELGLSCVIKLNPMLLGKEETRRLLHDVMGYRALRAPDAAFDRDLTWEQAVEIVPRLGATAQTCGLHLGVKFSNTLVVENDASFLPAEAREVYLSGPPLHVLAMSLVLRLRREFGDRFPISFSAGIDRSNFPDAAALGLVPITVCTDLLKTGGYGRLPAYYRELAVRMDAVGACTVDDFVLRAHGQTEAALLQCGLADDDPARHRCLDALTAAGDVRAAAVGDPRAAAGGDLRTAAAGSLPAAAGSDLHAAAGDALYARWVSQARLLNTERYVHAITEHAHDPDSHYGRAHNARAPRKIGRHLQLFDCISCDKCIPVCPNDAMFALRPERGVLAVVMLRRADGGWRWDREGSLELHEEHQIATFVDFCNDCGNCDVFCPEDGGPYRVKPRFFGSREGWEHGRPLDGLFVQRRGGRDLVLGRFGGEEYRLEVSAGWLEYSGVGFHVRFQESSPQATLQVQGKGESGRLHPVPIPDEVDLTWCYIMDRIRQGILDPTHVNYVNTTSTTSTTSVTGATGATEATGANTALDASHAADTADTRNTPHTPNTPNTPPR